MSNPKQTLLHLRKSFKRSKTTRQTAANHKTFLLECQTLNLQPKGLQIKLPCVALASNSTNIKKEFEKILTETQKKLTQSLVEHYQQVEETNRKLSNQTLVEITNTQATTPPADLQTHSKIMEATQRNIAAIIKK